MILKPYALSGPLSAPLTGYVNGPSTLNDNLVSYYDYGGTDRVVASGNDMTHSAIIADTNYTARGHVNEAGMNFNNNLQDVWTLPDPAAQAFDPDKDFSIAWWARVRDVITTYGVFWKGTTLRCSISGTFRYYNVTVGLDTLVLDVDMVLDVWHHAVVTYDSTTLEMKVSANGGTNELTSTLGAQPVPNTGAFEIGENGGGQYFNGQMEQFCYWDRVLTEPEKVELYNSGAGVNFLDV